MAPFRLQIRRNAPILFPVFFPKIFAVRNGIIIGSRMVLGKGIKPPFNTKKIWGKIWFSEEGEMARF
jgi:hypothetical protein